MHADIDNANAVLVSSRHQGTTSPGYDDNQAPGVKDNASGRHSFVLLAGIACTVLGAKLIAISCLASSIPIADQWDGEAVNLYVPYLQGTLSFGDLFAPHNEHRIFVFRILSLIHLELAGEWNTRLEMIFGAFVHTAAITWLAALLMPVVAAHRRIILASFVAFLFALPIGYENMLTGFQSQVYLMLLFGIAALAACSTARAFSVRWFCGLAAAILSYLSFATGVATIIAVGGLMVLQMLTKARPRSGREYAAVALMAFAVLAIVVWTASSAHPLSTPWTVVQGVLLLGARVIVAFVPVFWFCRYTIGRRPVVDDRAWVIVGISAWIAIQVAMLAYGRGNTIAVRYFDILLFIYPVAVVAIFAFIDKARATRYGRFAVTGAVAWMFTVVTACAAVGYLFVLGAVDWSRAATQEADNVRTYFTTSNLDDLKKFGHGHTFDLAYPNSDRQAKILSNPDVRAILPPEFRPLDADNAAVRKRMVTKGEFAGVTATAVHFVLSLGPALLALGIGSFFAVGTRLCLSDERTRLLGERPTLRSSDEEPALKGPSHTAVITPSASESTSEPITEFSPQRLG